MQSFSGGKAIGGMGGVPLAVNSQKITAVVAQKICSDARSAFCRGWHLQFLGDPHSFFAMPYLLIQVQKLDYPAIAVQRQRVGHFGGCPARPGNPAQRQQVLIMAGQCL